MLADNVNDRNLCAAGVVQICDAIRKSRAEMQERTSRLSGHSRIAVRSSRHHAFEKAKYATHFRHDGPSAATICISEVPGFVKHTSTPQRPKCESDFLRHSYYWTYIPRWIRLRSARSCR